MNKQVENVSKDDKARHSGFGVASLFFALFPILNYLLWKNNSNAMMDPFPLLIMFVIPTIFSPLLGLIFGTIGLSRKDKIFSKVGVV